MFLSKKDPNKINFLSILGDGRFSHRRIECWRFYSKSSAILLTSTFLWTPFKHVRFSVYRGDELIMRYFLESTQMDEMYFVLGSMSLDYRHHSQIEPYGPIPPKYKQMKNTVIRDLTVGIAPLLSSTKGGF